jgi:hypothetical protein
MRPQLFCHLAPLYRECSSMRDRRAGLRRTFPDSHKRHQNKLRTIGYRRIEHSKKKAHNESVLCHCGDDARGTLLCNHNHHHHRLLLHMITPNTIPWQGFLFLCKIASVVKIKCHEGGIILRKKITLDPPPPLRVAFFRCMNSLQRPQSAMWQRLDNVGHYKSQASAACSAAEVYKVFQKSATNCDYQPFPNSSNIYVG